MMPAVDILRDEIAENAADQHVGGKVLAGSYPRNIHQGGQAVRENLRERTGILMRHHAGDRPGCSGVFGGKRRAAALKKRTATIALKRALAPEGIFHSLDHHQAVKRSFSS